MTPTVARCLASGSQRDIKALPGTRGPPFIGRTAWVTSTGPDRVLPHYAQFEYRQRNSSSWLMTSTEHARVGLACAFWRSRVCWISGASHQPGVSTRQRHRCSAGALKDGGRFRPCQQVRHGTRLGDDMENICQGILPCTVRNQHVNPPSPEPQTSELIRIGCQVRQESDV